MPKAQRHALIAGLIVVDGLAVALAVLAAREWTTTLPGSPTGSASLAYLFKVTIPVAIGLFALNRLYVLDELFEGPIEYGRIAYACALTALSLSVLGFWSKDLAESVPSRRLVVLVAGLALLMVGAGRFVARRVVRALRRRGYLVSRALIVGLGTAGISMARHFQELKHAGVQVVGFIDDFLPPGTPVTDGLKVLGPPSAVSRILADWNASEMIVLPTAMAWESFQDLIRTASNLNGRTIRLAPGFREILATNVRVHEFGFIPLLTIERVRITGLDAILKRIMDYAMAVVLASLALPVIAATAVVLASHRLRPFLSTRVIGRGGVVFRTFLLNTDPRSRAQRVLREFGVDRLPQLINVFRGEMSIVGPRPIPYEQRDRYERWLPNLLTVKPGMTGPWALHEHLGSLDEEMRTSLLYIRNYNLWLDLEIILRSGFGLVNRPAAGNGASRPASSAVGQVPQTNPPQVAAKDP